MFLRRLLRNLFVRFKKYKDKRNEFYWKIDLLIKKNQQLEYKTDLLSNQLNGYFNTFFDISDVKPPTEISRTFQELSLYLLENFKKICDENGIDYWLQGGALIGAARNGKLVPWDDDIDIGMMRNELKKLRSVMYKYDEFEIVDYYFLSYKPCKLPKFFIKGGQIPCFIDIFTHDFVNYTDRSAYWHEYSENKYELQQKLFNLNLIRKYNNEPIEHQKSLNKVEEIFNQYIQVYNHKEIDTHIIFGIENLTQYHEYLFDADWIFPLSKIVLEGEVYKAPARYDKYLYNQYGDIYRFPKDCGQPTHVVCNCEEYENIKSFLNDKKLLTRKGEL